jgi:GDP-4-dehydro-6-deoxy-D-mannose reductase
MEYLRQNNYDVVAGVRNRARKLAYERQNGKALVCEVTDAINVARAIASVRPDAVVHLAGSVQPADVGEEPLTAYQTIVTSWANVLDAVRRAVPRAKVVLASACDVYGNAGGDGRALDETTPPAPVSTYGSLKATAETIAHTYHRDYHLDVTIARPFHYTGPGQAERCFFANAARRLMELDPTVGHPTLTLPDLDCRRELLHVDDVVAAYARLLQDGRPNEVYNICAGKLHTCREIIKMMARAAGRSIELADLSTGEGDSSIAALCGNPDKIRNELNWTPTRSVEDAVRDLVGSIQARPATIS